MIPVGLLTLVLLVSAWPTGTAAIPDDSPRFDAGMSLYRANDCSGALLQFEASKTAGEDVPVRSFYEGVCLAKQSEWSHAEERLAPYAANHPRDARAWYWLAQSQLYQKNFASARESMLKALNLDGKSVEAQRGLGEIELELRNYDGAYHAWIQANKLDPTDARTTYYLGRLFFEAEFLDVAASWFRQTLKLAPSHFAAMTYLAMCAERLDMESTAVALYRSAIRESKQQGKPFPWAYTGLAKLLRQLGSDQEALAILQEAEKVCPEAHLLTVLGQLLASANQGAKAESVLRRAIEMDDSIPDAHYRLALLLGASGRGPEAQAEMRRFQQAKDAEERNKAKIQAIRKNG